MSSDPDELTPALDEAVSVADIELGVEEAEGTMAPGELRVEPDSDGGGGDVCREKAPECR